MKTLQKQQSKLSLFEWFGSSEDLVKIGFTKSEIEQAMKTAKTKLSDITDDYNFAEYTANTSWIENNKFCEIIDDNTRHTFKDSKIIKGEEWSREYTARAIQYRTRSNYQTFDSNILEALLKKKFPFFKKFKWEIYAIHSEAENWEIYLKTEYGSVYVPVKALFLNDHSIIEKRMSEYWNMYRTNRDPKIKRHNHKKDEHPQHCPLCQQRFYEKEMKPLQSKEFEALKKELIK